LVNRRLRHTEKLVLARIADYWRADLKVAAISMEQLAGECCLSEVGLRPVMRDLLVHQGCPHPEHADVRGDGPASEGCCVACRAEFVERGCIRVTSAETAKRARRYDILVFRLLKGKAAYPLSEISTASTVALEDNLPSPRGQEGFPVGGKELPPRGKAACPVPDLPSCPDLPERSPAPETAPVHAHESTEDDESAARRRPSIHDDAAAVERVRRGLLETKRRILARSKAS